MASRLNGVVSDMKRAKGLTTHESDISMIDTAVEYHEDVMSEVYKGLNRIAQDLGSHITNTDAIDPMDASLMEQVFNLVLNAPFEDPQTLPNPDELPY